MTCPQALVRALALCAIIASTAHAWHEQEHQAITATVQRLLPEDMPAWFATGVRGLAAHCSVDPDVFKNRATPHLRDAEAPDHYLDLELVGEGPMPKTRYGFIALCARKGVDPERAGVLPYAVTEWTQRLTLAFAEHRKWPDDPHIRAKCLVYAGNLAHYAADLCQPLHTTIHFDGRADEDGASPHTGIHQRVDGLLHKLDVGAEEVAKGLEATAFKGLSSAVFAEFDRSHGLVERVYELEDRLPSVTAKTIRDPEVRAFATERMRAGIRFTASLYGMAWAESGELGLPTW